MPDASVANLFRRMAQECTTILPNPCAFAPSTWALP